MSLFVGNISRSARTEDIEKDFKKYGHCTIKFKGSYAFVEFENEKDGEDAIKNLQNKMIGGRELNIEWSKKSGRYDSSKRKRKSISPRRRDRDQRCYKCGHRGHFSYECRDRSRHRRRSHSRSDSRHRHRKRSSSSRHRKRSRSSSDRKKRSHRKRSESSRSSSSRSERKDDKSPVRKSQSVEKKDDNIKASESKNVEKNGINNHNGESNKKD